MRTSFKAFLIIALALWVVSAVAEDPTYIGAAKCKMCHKAEYTSWLETPHAKAFDRLKPEEQGNEECLTCHATGASAEMPGVQCEACHGPGSGYKSMKVMKDLQASLAAGLIKPDEAYCKKCHEKAPHDLPAFDYETAKATGLHEMKAAE